jgi:hypothetical protein
MGFGLGLSKDREMKQLWQVAGRRASGIRLRASGFGHRAVDYEFWILWIWIFICPGLFDNSMLRERTLRLRSG